MPALSGGYGTGKLHRPRRLRLPMAPSRYTFSQEMGHTAAAAFLQSAGLAARSLREYHDPRRAGRALLK
jgi:hypothetical protein